MPIKAVIFDLGGVLVRTEDRRPRTQLAERLGMTYDDLSAVIFDSPSAQQAQLGEITTAQHWKAVRETLDLSPTEFLDVPEDFWGGDALDRMLVDFLRGLQPDIKTALLSNAWDDLRQIIEDFWRIEDAFDEMIISAEVGLVKPDARIYQLVISRLGVDPSEAVFLDDFPENVVAAREVGLQAIHFKDREQALVDLNHLLDGR
jgi:epoxide hydrolase-like predicted phosphatase